MFRFGRCRPALSVGAASAFALGTGVTLMALISGNYGADLTTPHADGKHGY
jgi:hypothetical protein